QADRTPGAFPTGAGLPAPTSRDRDSFSILSGGSVDACRGPSKVARGIYPQFKQRASLNSLRTTPEGPGPQDTAEGGVFGAAISSWTFLGSRGYSTVTACGTSPGMANLY